MAKSLIKNINPEYFNVGLHLNPNFRISEDAIVSEVNKRLNEPATRSQGLSILKPVIPDCSDEVVTKHAIFWWQQCVKETGSNSNNRRITLAYEVLLKILKRTACIPEMKKQISTHITSSITDLLKSEFKDFQSTVAALEFLENLLTEYGSTCKSSKDSVEKVLLKFVSEMDPSATTVAAAHCFSALPLASPATHSSSVWSVQVEKTCNTLHYLLTVLYEDDFTTSGSDGNMASDIYNLPLDTKSDKICAIKKHTLMFCNMASFLETMLRSPFPFAKEISPLMIIRVIVHALQNDHFELHDKETRTYMTLSCNTPLIQLAALSLMEGLIFSCSHNLLPFTVAVNRLLTDSLHWVTGSRCNFGLHYVGLVKVAVYKVVTLWMKAVRSSNIVDPVLIRTLLQDLGIKKQSDDVPDDSESLRTMNQEKGSKQSAEQLNRSGPHVDATVCHGALETLRWLLRSFRVIDLDTFKAIQDFCLTQLLYIQRCSFPSSYPAPYETSHCRLELYRLMFTCLMEPHHAAPPAAHLIIDLLSVGQNDTNPEVAGYCTEVMSSAEKIIHPSRADLCHSLVNSSAQGMYTTTTTEHVAPPSQPSTSFTTSKKTVVEEVIMDSSEEESFSYKKTSEEVSVTIVEIDNDKDEGLVESNIEPLVSFFDDSSSSSDVSFVSLPKELGKFISGAKDNVDSKVCVDPKNNIQSSDSDVEITNDQEQVKDKAESASSSTSSDLPSNTDSNDVSATDNNELHASNLPPEANEESDKDQNIENNSGEESLETGNITYQSSKEVHVETSCETSKISEIVVNTVTMSHSTKRLPESAADEPELKKKKEDSSGEEYITVQNEDSKDHNSKTADSDTEPSEVDINEVNEVCSMITFD